MHPNLSKVTMHLNPFWTNYPTLPYKPLIVANGKQKSTSNLNVCACVWIGVYLCVPACSIYFSYTHTHMHSKVLSIWTYSTLSVYRTLWMHQVINWQLQIPAMWYNQFHLHLPCLLLHIFFGNCNCNEWLVRPDNGHFKLPRLQKKAWCECINTNMVHQLVCVHLQKHPQKVVGGNNSQWYLTPLLTHKHKKNPLLRWLLMWTKCC